MCKELTLIGLPNCDSCRKARQALSGAGFTVTFRDLRADPLDPDAISGIVDRFGEAALNRRSTTWRGLSEDQRAQPPESLLLGWPTLLKRPLILRDGAMTLGWTPEVRAEYGL